jgi:hypothetical protein
MAHIVRPPKTAGTNQYQTEVAAGATAILDTEVDADFTTIYSMVNGNLDNDNISGSPTKIDGHKLNLTGVILPSDLDPTFKLPAGQVADHTIGPLQLFAARSDHSGTAGSASPAPFVTEVGNLGLFSVVAPGTPKFGKRDDSYALPEANEQILVEEQWTTRGGPILVWATCYLTVLNNNPAVAGGTTCTLQIRQGGIGGLDGGVVVTRPSQTITIPSGTAGPFGIQLPCTLTIFFYTTFLLGMPPNNLARFALTLTGGQVATAQFTHRNSALFCVELA